DIDILFLMSSSASMATIDGDASPDSRWAAASRAVRAFATMRSGRAYGAGLAFFPQRNAGDGGIIESCAATDYETPAVAIAPLDDTGMWSVEIETALGARTVEGGNAMTAALTGALRAAARAKSRTGHVVQTVLVTDGTGDPCGGDVASAAAIAGEAFQ